MSSQDLLYKFCTGVFTSTHCSDQKSAYTTQKTLDNRSCWDWSDGASSTLFPLMFPTPLSTRAFYCLCVKYGPWSKQSIAAMDLTWVSLRLMLIATCKPIVLLNFHSASLWVACVLKSGFTLFCCLLWASSVIFLAGSNGLLVCLAFSFPIFARIILVYWIFIQMKFLSAWGYRITISWLRQSLTPAQMK